MLEERGEGVDRVARAGADLEVQVRAGHVAGGTDGADRLAAAHGVTDVDEERGLVAVPELGAVLEGLARSCCRRSRRRTPS